MEYLLTKAKKCELDIDPNSMRLELQSCESLTMYLEQANHSAYASLHYMLSLSSVLVDEENLLVYDSLLFDFNKYLYARKFRVLPPHVSALNPGRCVYNEEYNSYSRNNQSINAHVNEMYKNNEEVLMELYAWCLESTIWHAKHYRRYVGSMWQDGFDHPLLLQIADEMRSIFDFLEGKPLVQMWAFNYHSEETHGINLHADSALVNINLWITPDEANMNPDEGGLIIYTKPLLGNETFEQMQIPSFGYEYLKGSEHLNYTIPYKRNRITIFNSNLYHETSPLHFKPGYKNRRINFTFLFGTSSQWMQHGKGDPYI